MEQLISKQELDKLMERKGRMRGFGLKTLLGFILREEGQEGFKKLKNAMKKLGCSIDFENIKILDFYPFNWHIITFVVIEKLFNYDNKKFQELGAFSVKNPFMSRRFFMKTIRAFSFKLRNEETQKIWKKVFDIGTIKITEIGPDKKSITLEIKDFDSHPFFCQALTGVFLAGSKMLIGLDTFCEEVECENRGGNRHRFLIKW